MKNWKTTVAGLAGALLINVVPILQGDWTVEKLITGIVVAVLGFLAKDWNVTGVGLEAKTESDIKNEYL